MDSISKACIDNKIARLFSHKLETEFIGKETLFFPEVHSTNQLAKELAEKLKNGTVLIADSQNQGQGRRGRKWISPKGMGLWFTIVIKNPKIQLAQLSVINTLISVVIVNSVKKITDIDLRIKWPNDLQICGKKVCGILSEVYHINNIPVLISGIGINTDGDINFPEISINGCGLNLKGKETREALLKEILEEFEIYYVNLINKKDRKFLKEWKSYSINIGSKVILIEDKECYKVIDIGELGELIIENNRGIRKHIYSGDEILQNKQGITTPAY